MSVEVAPGHQQLAVDPSLRPACGVRGLSVRGGVVSATPFCCGIAGRVSLGAHGGPEKIDAQGVPDVIACVSHGERDGLRASWRRRRHHRNKMIREAVT